MVSESAAFKVLEVKITLPFVAKGRRLHPGLGKVLLYLTLILSGYS